MDTISREALEGALEQAGHYEVEEIVRDGYSGRGMNGKVCVGLVLGSANDLVQVAVRLAAMMGEEEAHDFFGDMCEDSMGLDRIYYFPGWTVEDE